MLKKILKFLLPSRVKNWIKNIGFKSKYGGGAIYWENRYKTGGNSGTGSYGKLAEFKADTIKKIITYNKIKSVVELGCGDGNQISLTFSDNISYLGLDISKTVIQKCIERFEDDKHKDFLLFDSMNSTNKQGFIKGDMAISLDVIYHLIEDEVYIKYMEMLFSIARRYVIIYSSNHQQDQPIEHCMSRKFTNYVEANFKKWELVEHIPNKYPLAIYSDGSWADFYIYKYKDSDY